MRWMPLPKIVHGIVIYPFSPSTIMPQLRNKSDSKLTTNNIYGPSSMASSVQHPNDVHSTSSFEAQKESRQSNNIEDYNHLIHLEIGDEVYIIEQQGQWYRGYVCTAMERGQKANKAPIGCFPRNHVHVKEYIEIDANESNSLIQNSQHFNHDLWKKFISRSDMSNDLNRSFSESHIDTCNISQQSSFVRTGSLSNLNAEQVEFNDFDDGEFPLTHMPPPPLPMYRLDQSTLTGYYEPLVDEISSCITQWNNLFYTYLIDRDYKTFNFLKENVRYLFKARRQLADQALSREELAKLRKDVINRMLFGNLKLKEDMIIRHPEKGFLLDIKKIPLSAIYQLHWKYTTHKANLTNTSTPDNPNNIDLDTKTTVTVPLNDITNNRVRSISNQSSIVSNANDTAPQLNTAKFHHVYLALDSFVTQIGHPGDFTELHFSLFSKTSHKFITEEYIVYLNFDGTPRDASKVGKFQAIFVDLSSSDLSEGVYLVCHIVRLGSLKLNESLHHYFDHFGGNFLHANKRNNNGDLCRRPVGCAVLKLMSQDFQKEPIRFDMPIYAAFSESNFTTLHEDIINGNAKDLYRKTSQTDKLIVTLKSFYGCIKDIIRANAKLLQNATHTLRIGFADVSFPNDSRNELYIRLYEGIFTQFGRYRNIQVGICVRDNETGDIIENAICVGAGAKDVSYWKSMVIYHEQRPKWNELIKIQIQDLKQWQRSHVFITIKHKSSHYSSGINSSSSCANGVLPETPGDMENVIAMGFLPIFLPPTNRGFVADGSHTICMYKYDSHLTLPRHYLNTVPWCSKSTAPHNMTDPTGEARFTTQLRLGVRSLSNHSSKSASGSLISSRSLNTAKATSEMKLNAQLGLGQQYSNKKPIPLRDTIHLSTFLCSTKFTQNETLVRLLNWQTLLQSSDNGRSKLLSVLDQFTFVGEVEVVKFLDDIFDSLLNIMAYHENEAESINKEIHDKVLSAIVWLLGIVQDRRFSNFKPGLNVYLDHRFSMMQKDTSNSHRIATFKYFISSLTRLCENPGDPSKAKLLRSSIKVWNYLFRLIVKSRLYYQNIEPIEEKNKFKHDMNNLLGAITDIMSSKHPSSMIGTQTMALQHFASILLELQEIFSCEHIMDITVLFVDTCSHVTGRIVGFKLMFILNIMKGPIFDNSSCKADLAKHIFRWIKIWINCYMVTAEDVNFVKEAQEQHLRPRMEQTEKSGILGSQQSRIPKKQWIENLRLSLTIMKELLNNARTSAGMNFCWSTSSEFSPVISTSSRPTSFSAMNNDKEEPCQIDLPVITDEALTFVPQFLLAYKDLQQLVSQTTQVSDSPDDVDASESNVTDSNSNSRPHSRHSFGKLRERGISLSSKPPLPSDLFQDGQKSQTRRTSVSMASAATNNMSPNTINSIADSSDSKTKFNTVLQALSTSPQTPFPYVFPFQANSKPATSENSGFASAQEAMVTTGLLDLTVVILELFYLVPQKQWVDFIKNKLQQEGLEDTADFLKKVVYTCMGILFGDNLLTLEESTLLTDNMGRNDDDINSSKRKLPYQWLNLNVIAHKIILCDILNPIKQILELPEFIPTQMAYASIGTDTGNFAGIRDDGVSAASDKQLKEHLPAFTEKSTHNSLPSQSTSKIQHDKTTNTSTIEEQRSALLLWRVYYVGFLRVVGSPRLDITEFKPQSQRAIYQLVHNLRGECGAKTLLFLWNLAGKSSRAFGVSPHISDVEDNNNYDSYVHSDYFGHDSRSLPDYGCSTDVNPFSKSRASNDDTENCFNSSVSSFNTSFNGSQYTARHSVRIAPTEQAPIKPMDKEKHANLESNMPFLQVDLAHFILRPLASASMTLHDRVRTNTLSIIADIIAIELCSSGELIYVQKTLIGALDHIIMSEKKSDEELASRMTLEIGQLLSQRLQKDGRDDLQHTGKIIIESLGKFLALLLQVRSLPADDDEYMDERIMSTLRLMKFIQVIEREEIYVKYVHQLVQVHIDNHNFVEAALTLRFHSDLLPWEINDRLPAVPELGLPIQSSFERKERLYMTMIQYLDRGCAWEICNTLCKELAYEYEHTKFDYSKLSKIFQLQANFVDSINNKERCFTEYFRVGFYGRGFPASNRNNQYIYRGLEWEKLDSFIERMQNRHPNAEILPSKVANSLSLSEERLKEIDSTLDGKFIQITPVTPIADIQMIPCLSNSNAPENIKKYYEFNNVNKFIFTRVIEKDTETVKNAEESPESDFLNLWTEKISFESEDKFPAIVKRSKIVKADSTLISPIENAIETVEKKNRELVSLEQKYSALVPKNGLPSSSTQPVNINPFSMSLNGAVDAPVNGGIPLYKKAFLSKEYWDKYADMRQWVVQLQEAIQDQVAIIQECLYIHGLLVSDEMRPFHSILVEFFHKNFEVEIKSLEENPTAKNVANERQRSSTFTNQRRSTLSSTTDNTSVYSHHFQQSYDEPKLSSLSRQNTIANSRTPGAIATLSPSSPISRAFSIKSPAIENSPGNLAPENMVMSRTESLSRTLRMSLRKKTSKEIPRH